MKKVQIRVERHEDRVTVHIAPGMSIPFALGDGEMLTIYLDGELRSCLREYPRGASVVIKPEKL